MKLRSLGASDLFVSPIGLGCWQFSKGNGLAGKYWPVLTDETIKGIVKVSIEGGVNWFDTAEMYGKGESEKALSTALISLEKTTGNVIIATKWSPMFRTAASILRTIDDRFRSLQNLRIDLYQVHQPLGFSTVEKEMDAMARLVDAKKIRYVGVSNFSADRMRRAHAQLCLHGLALVSNQMRYSLLDRRIEKNGVVETAKELGISIIAYSPLAQGILTGKFHKQSAQAAQPVGIRRHLAGFRRGGLERSRPLITRLGQVAEAHGSTPAQVALQWLTSFQGKCVVAIPGATSVAQAMQNAKSMEIVLTQDEMHSLDEVSKGCQQG